MKKLISLAGVLLLVGASQAWAWTMYYDGFDYGPPSPGSVGCPAGAFQYYKVEATAYQLGDPFLPYQPTICGALHPMTYPASPWVAGATSSLVGYWPFVVAYNLTTAGAPIHDSAVGRSIALFGSASNDGKCVRVCPIDLQQKPPTGPYPVFTTGKLYYSLIVWGLECVTSTTPPGNGEFYAGFDHLPPSSSSPQVVAGRAAARLRLRRAQGDGIGSAFNVGIQTNEPSGSTATLQWAPSTYVGGELSTPILVVVSYEFRNNEGADPITNDDVCSLWVNPDPATFGDNSLEPAPLATSSGAAADPPVENTDMTNLQIQSFFIREAGSAGTANKMARVMFDELRIGTTWAGVTSNVAAPCNDPRFDMNGDRDVDQADFAVFQACFTGVEGSGGVFDAEVCRCVNSDGDQDIDGDDRAAFEACASGPGIVANPACDDLLPSP